MWIETQQGDIMKLTKHGWYSWTPWRTRNGNERVVASESGWDQPGRLNRQAAKSGERPRIMIKSDVFEDWAGSMMLSKPTTEFRVTFQSSAFYREPLTLSDVRRRLFALIDSTPNVDWMLPTAWPVRAEKMKLVRWEFDSSASSDTGCMIDTPVVKPSVWLGAIIHDQPTADKLIPELLKVPAAKRFVVAEMTGTVNMRNISPLQWDVLIGWKPAHGNYPEGCNTDRLDLVIARGQSGRDAKPCNLAWIRSMRDQCEEAGVGFMIEQLGSKPVEWTRGDAPNHEPPELEQIQLRNRHGSDPSEWPADLQPYAEMPTS